MFVLLLHLGQCALAHAYRGYVGNGCRILDAGGYGVLVELG